MRNILLSASLICALISSAMSIFIMSRWSRGSAKLNQGNQRDPHNQAYTREHRHETLLAWKMQDIVMSISLLLQVVVALFVVGLLLFVWRLGPVLRGIAAGLIMFWLTLTLVSALCAAVFPSCPFKSPVSRALFQAQQVVWGVLTGPFRRNRQRQHALGYTSEEKEWRDVCRQQPRLASNALRYAFNVCWADQEAAMLFPCLEDVEAEAALKLVLALIRLRLGEIVQDASLGATAAQHMSPNSMEYQNLQSLSALAVKLVQERPDGLFAGSSTHRALGHHDKHLLKTIRSYVAAASGSEGECSAGVVGHILIATQNRCLHKTMCPCDHTSGISGYPGDRRGSFRRSFLAALYVWRTMYLPSRTLSHC